MLKLKFFLMVQL